MRRFKKHFSHIFKVNLKTKGVETNESIGFIESEEYFKEVKFDEKVSSKSYDI